MSKPVLHACLESVLSGEKCSLPSQVVKVKEREIGELSVPTVKIVACDPCDVSRPVAFALKAPRGTFPVRVYIAHYKDRDQRIAAARLDFFGGTPNRWKTATLPDQDVSTLEEGYTFGYGVDSGCGSFMDHKVAKRIETRMKKRENVYQSIMEEMEETYIPTRSWAMIDVGDGNAAAFSAGHGDGFYASYWGWSGKKLSCLVTDFGLLRVDTDQSVGE